MSSQINLFSCGSNASYHLALGHNDDVSTFTQAQSPRLPDGATNPEVIDLCSSSGHTLMIVECDLSGDDGSMLKESGDSIGSSKPGFDPGPDSHPYSKSNSDSNSKSRYIKRYRELYGIGTNTYGQLGRPCALRDEDDKQVLREWRRIELVRECGVEGGDEEWEVRKVGATWTGSLVVYRRKKAGASPAGSATSTAGAGLEAGSKGTAMPSTIGSEIQEIIIACGSNDFNELGLTTSELLDKADTTELMDGHSPVTGINPPRVVRAGLKSGEWVEHLKGGQRHVVVVISRGEGKNREQRVVGWGAGRRGELDLGTLAGGDDVNGLSASLLTRGENSTAGDKSKGKSKSKGKGKSAARPTTYPPTELSLLLDPGELIADLSLGSSHTLVMTSRGRVIAWGSDTKSQITGLGELTDVAAVGATWGGSYLVMKDGNVWSQGSNIYGQLLWPFTNGPENHKEVSGAVQAIRGRVAIPKGRTVRRIITGSEHILAILLRTGDRSGNESSHQSDVPKDELWVGGWNEHGNLGLGDQVNRAELVEVDTSMWGLPGDAFRIRGAWGGCASSWIWVR